VESDLADLIKKVMPSTRGGCTVILTAICNNPIHGGNNRAPLIFVGLAAKDSVGTF